MDKRLVLLSSDDNVLVCCGKILAGESVALEGSNVEMVVDINVGHKVARNDIATGDKIIKYGAPIGSSIAKVAQGEHIHMHNMKSDYIASHTRDSRGES